jgi:hypothetical protein
LRPAWALQGDPASKNKMEQTKVAINIIIKHTVKREKRTD